MGKGKTGKLVGEMVQQPRQESKTGPLDRPVSAVGQERLRSGGLQATIQV